MISRSLNLLPYLRLIIAASAAFSMSTLFSSVKPVLLTQFMREAGFEAGLSGGLVAAPFIGISIAALAIGPLLANYSYRSIHNCSGLVLVCCQLLNGYFFTHPIITLSMQLLSGISVGILMGATSSIIARTHAADTLFGFVDMIGVLLMSFMVAGASITTVQFGLAGGFLFSALLVFLYWMAMYVYSPEGNQETARNIAEQAEFKISLRPVIIILMGVLFVTFSGQGFAFMFTIASNLGMTYEQAGNNIGLLLFLSAFACLGGGICSARFGPEIPLFIAFMVCALGWTVAVHSQTQGTFLLGLYPAIFSLQFCFPVLLSLAGMLDKNGRWAALATPLLGPVNTNSDTSVASQIAPI